MKKIIYTDKKTGNFCLVTPSEEYKNNLNFIASLSVPKDCEYFIIDSQDLPKETIFFDAFRIEKKLKEISVIIDISKVKEIWKDKFREARKPILEKLDVEYIRADEQDNTSLKQEIVTIKQQLRDVTLIQLPDDIEGIKNTWPEILNVSINFSTEVPELSTTITEEPSSTEVPELSTTITEEPSSTEVPELSTTITEEPSSTEVPELSS